MNEHNGAVPAANHGQQEEAGQAQEAEVREAYVHLLEDMGAGDALIAAARQAAQDAQYSEAGSATP